MWECPKCHERHEDSFEVCWNCGTSKTGVEDPDFRAADRIDPGSLEQPVIPPASHAAAATAGLGPDGYEFSPK
jgi:hypothetical protein